jgi:hypothetical protein
MPPVDRQDSSRKRKIRRRRQKFLLLEANMRKLNPYAIHPSRHLGRWKAYTLWPGCHADVGYNPPGVELTDNQLSDVQDNFKDMDD